MEEIIGKVSLRFGIRLQHKPIRDEALHKANVRAISLPPSSIVIASEGKVSVWRRLLYRMAFIFAPWCRLFFGDVVFDEIRGGTILIDRGACSWHLALALSPERILLATDSNLRWWGFPRGAHKKLEKITHRAHSKISAGFAKPRCRCNRAEWNPK